VERRKRQQCKIGPFWGVGTNRRGEEVGKVFSRANMVQMLCTYIYLYIYGKMISLETYRNGRR
jgi:hypothetical protein